MSVCRVLHVDDLIQSAGDDVQNVVIYCYLIQMLNHSEEYLSSPRLSLLSLLTNMLPAPSTSEVTTLWRYTNLFIIKNRRDG